MIQQSGGWTAAWFAFWLIIFVSFVPVLPIPLIAAAAGAVLPLVPATLDTWLAACVGALMKFAIERWLLRRPADRWLRRYRHWRSLVEFLQKHGFYAVLVTRCIPVFPSSVVNTAGALTGIPVRSFVTATLLGKLPTMVAFTVAGNLMWKHPWQAVAWTLVYAGLMVLLTWWARRWFRASNRG